MTQEAMSRTTSRCGGDPHDEEPWEERCPICDGYGWVERRVPLGHPDFGELFPCRCREYAAGHERMQRLQRYSGLSEKMLDTMTFDKFLINREDFDHRTQDSLEKAYIAATEFALNPEGWLLFSGTYGCGKTHLAVAIVERRIKSGHASFFAFVPDLLDHLRAAFSPESPMRYDDLFEQVKSAPFLILDDLGAETSTPWAREKLYQIIVHRHNAQIPTVITTYMKLQDMEKTHPRLSSRLVHTFVNWVPIAAPDYRNQDRPSDNARHREPNGRI